MAFLAVSGQRHYFWQGHYDGGDPGVKEWRYIGQDSLATVTTAAYITETDIIRKLSVGDFIRVFQCTDRNDISTQTVTFQVKVTAKTSTSVTLAAVTVSGAETSLITETTAAALASLTNAINTTGKFRGKLVSNESDRIYWAVGATAASKWRPMDGQTGADDITPV